MSVIKIHIMQCGTIHPPIKRSLFSGWMDLPCWCLFIEHPKGNILIDTGLAPVSLPDKLASYYMIEIPSEQTIKSQLDRLSFKETDIDAIYLTDLHPDKTLGLLTLNESKNVFICNEEWENRLKEPFKKSQIDTPLSKMKVIPYSFENSGIGPQGKSFDIYGDGTVIAVLSNGHTLGNTSFLIQNNGNKLLFSGNSTLNNHSLDTWNVYDKDLSKRSLKWIEEISKTNGCIASISSHDTDEFERVLTI